MGRVETVDNTKGASGCDPEHDANIVRASGGRRAVEVAIPSLGQDFQVLRTASIALSAKFKKISIILRAYRGRAERQEIEKQYEFCSSRRSYVRESSAVAFALLLLVWRPCARR